MASFKIWHFSTSIFFSPIRSPGSFCHGVCRSYRVAGLWGFADFLSVRPRRRSIGVFLEHVGASLMELWVLFAFGDEMWSLVHLQTTFWICIYTLYKYSFDFFMCGCKCISYININPNDTVCHFRDCIQSLAWNLRYDQPTWEIWLVLQVDSYGPLIMQHRTWQRKIDSGKVFAHKGI